MKKEIKKGVVLMALLGVVPFASAALLITNGDFETYTADQAEQEDITGWYDYNNGTSWQNPWQDTRDAEVPTDSQSGYSGQGAAAFSGISASTNQLGVGLNGYLYQSIGTDASATAFDVTFDWGDFGNIQGSLRDLGLTIAVYEFNGTGSFVADNNTDVNGADGVTLLDSFSVVLNTAGAPSKLTIGESGTLDISSQSGGELFLRINNYDAGADTPWLMVDNVAISNVIPEPATIGLVAVFGAGVLFVRRRLMM